MAPAFVTASPLLNAVRPASAPRSRHTCSPRMDYETPPNSQISPNYPPSRRFLAPVISFFIADDFELMNGIGLNMEEAPLDRELAAQVTGGQVARDMQKAYTNGEAESMLDTDTLFPLPATDEGAETADMKYYPMNRRDETPIIECMDPLSEDAAVSISIGKVIATPPPETVHREPGFWKDVAGGTLSPEAIVGQNFPPAYRNKAPVISIGLGTLSMEMADITGEPEVDTYQPLDERFHAPVISMKPPSGDWDTSGYVQIIDKELQLPLMKTV